LIRFSEFYGEALEAAADFSKTGLKGKVKRQLPSARLFTSALRSINVYGPTRNMLETLPKENLKEDEKGVLRQVVSGLSILLDMRYHESYPDHRIFANLRQYHSALSLVDEGLASIKHLGKSVSEIHTNFLNAVQNVTLGNGILLTNWKRVPPQSTNFYAQVGLEISRLIAGEQIGVYTVRVKGKGRVPPHYHSYLEEHHFLPEAIDGVHLMGNRASRCDQSDIVYIGSRTVHGFRNDEDSDRIFMFISGGLKTGPWDFFPDITTVPGREFPKHIIGDVEETGGRRLQDVLDHTLGQSHSRSFRLRLSPEWMRLTHHIVSVEHSHELKREKFDREYFVANGSGSLEIEGRTSPIANGDVFGVQAHMDSKIIGQQELVLYEFGIRC